jgi:preprotein translocase subunit YajC
MNTWLSYYASTFLAALPILVIFAPFYIFIVRKMKVSQQRQKEAIEIQKEILMLLRQHIDQKNPRA